MLVNYNPLFPLRNYPRDFKTALVKGLRDTTGIEDAKSYVHLVDRSIKDIAKAKETDVDKLYKEMGGGLQTRVATSDITASGFKKVSKKLEKEATFGIPSASAKTAGFMKRILEGAERTNNHLELVPRKAAFLATLHALSKDHNRIRCDKERKDHRQGSGLGKDPSHVKRHGDHGQLQSPR